MTEGSQLTNITALNVSIFTYITSLFISPFCPPFPDVPRPSRSL
jgi:hypothetical protein